MMIIMNNCSRTALAGNLTRINTQLQNHGEHRAKGLVLLKSCFDKGA